jgi:poly-gamma-glutamate capsule biosynthesis protein CapA/YwtB (metallophosphatase superfamily)
VTLARPLVALLAVASLAACSAPEPTWVPAPPPPVVSAAPPPTSAAPSEVTLAFAGDVHFTGRTARLLDEPATALEQIAPVLSGADLAMVNLESAVTTRGTQEPKTFHFRAPAAAFAALKAAGVDVVSIANNHALDYGRVGLADTVAAAGAAGVPAIGAGANAAVAYAPWTATVRGTRIAFLGFSQVAELWQSWRATDTRAGIAMSRDLPRALAAVRAARQDADVVVVYLHWGVEGSSCPSSEMRTFAGELAKAGADLVIGTHAHLLLGDGWLGRTYVQYGLGNFVWWRNDAFSNDTGVLRVTLRGSEVVRTELVPARISRTTGQPIPATGAEATRIATKYEDLRGCTKLSASRS